MATGWEKSFFHPQCMKDSVKMKPDPKSVAKVLCFIYAARRMVNRAPCGWLFRHNVSAISVSYRAMERARVAAAAAAVIISSIKQQSRFNLRLARIATFLILP
ncbi:hypothetical protein PV326_012858 [Microctonus aethiopoides]|nr:hypothetical protein PV326_012858 [Microctonus aethiopoides]